MEFSWSEEQRQGYVQARDFGQRELTPGLDQRARDGSLPRDLWRRCAAFGIQGMAIPPKYGGLGFDIRSCVLALEGLGYGCRDNGLLMALGAQLWSVSTPLLGFGTEEQKIRWLPALAKGECVGAFALTESDGGSDAFRLRTQAEPCQGGFRLQGAKLFVTNAPLADLFIVLAATSPEGGYFGLTAFLVPSSIPGLRVGLPIAKMGLETSPTAEIALDDVELPPDSVLGEVGGGGAVLRNTLEWERGCLLAPAVGTMQRLLDTTVVHARARKQFGRPIVEFEAVAHQLAEMRLRLEVSRLLLYQFAWIKDRDRGADTQASMVKLYVSESFRWIAGAALHLHGAYGYTKDYEFERDWRDAMSSSIYSGTTEMQNNLIAESLLQSEAAQVSRQEESAA